MTAPTSRRSPGAYIATFMVVALSILTTSNLQAPREIELKFRITDSQKASVRTFLKSGGSYRGKETISDLYYDTPTDSLTANSWRLRVRNNATVTLKHTPADASARYEFEEHLPLTPAAKPEAFGIFKKINTTNELTTRPLNTEADIATYLATNNLICTCGVVKKRTTYEIDEFKVMYDEVEHLGTFLEIEFIAPDTITKEEIVEIQGKMRELISELGLSEEKKKYEALMLEHMAAAHK